MSAHTIKIAMAQMLVKGGDAEANLDRAEQMIRQAADMSCDLVLLPECLDVGWTHPSARQLAEPIPGRNSERLADLARSTGIHVVAGLTERDGERIYNAAVLIAPSGQILLVHRKVNILDIAQNLYSTGDRLSVADTTLGRLGINICADNFRESLCLGHSLAAMGAQAILSPCAWAVPADHNPIAEPYGGLWIDTYTEVARQHGIPVVGVSNVGPLDAGPWAGRKCIGCSLAVDRQGQIALQAGYGESAETLPEVVLQLGPNGTA